MRGAGGATFRDSGRMCWLDQGFLLIELRCQHHLPYHRSGAALCWRDRLVLGHRWRLSDEEQEQEPQLAGRSEGQESQE